MEETKESPLQGVDLAARLDAERPLKLKGFQQDAAELYVLGANEDLNLGFAAGDRYYDIATEREYDLERIADALDQAMRPLPCPAVVFRGGEGHGEGGFVSTAVEPATAGRFGRVREVLVPAGTPALWLGPLTEGEGELLLSREVALVEVGERLIARHGALTPSAGTPEIGH